MSWKLIFCLLFLHSCRVELKEIEEINGGWEPVPDDELRITANSIEEIDGNSLSISEFLNTFWDIKPVIIRNISTNLHFKTITTKQFLLKNFGDQKVILSTANTNSYDKFEEYLSNYILHNLNHQDINQLGNETLYLFGDNHFYELPIYMPENTQFSLSFGIGGHGSGVPFHTHGAVFAEVFFGAKRWFITQPNQKPCYSYAENTLFWLKNKREENTNIKILEGVCFPGDLFYLPANWYHATLNVTHSSIS